MNKLVAAIQGLFAPASVASVMSSFTKTIAKLDKVEKQNITLIQRNVAQIECLNKQIDLFDAEAAAASKAAARLRAIVQ